ncbi:hypothetical protein GOB93_03265 [Acetobacter musti]|uniref:Uncharacterized protein n=1 Tax=Acetobacter musti TaxID=864732 RepID=A0ABX0JLN3_9PROT|nr:hypothetical protein [Acetobacter musti]NHN83659.1 hypothetical protein [Acetobacter musti]
MSASRDATASPFAHLNRPRAEEPEKDENPDEGATTAEDPDDDKPEDDKTGKKGKKAKKADDSAPDDDGDDDTDAEDEKDEDKASARARERGRCAAIFRSAAAARNPAAAAEIAFGTTLTRSAAVRLLSTMPGAAPVQASAEKRAPALRDRMAAEGRQAVPANGGSSETTPGARLAASANARRGGK